MILIFLTIGLNSHFGHAQRQSFFAVGLVTGANSTVITYAIVSKIGDRYIGTQIIEEQYFMYYALGYWPCKANPDKENLFRKFSIPNCRLLYSNSGKVNGYYNQPFQELWKVRYKSHPQDKNKPPGWSQSYYQPSAGQARYLHETYGILNINTHYFVGEHLFQLLRDVQNPDWIEMYRSLPD